MTSKFFSPRTWSPTTRILVPVFIVLVALVVLFGLASVTGLALCIAAVTILLLGLTHRWRRIRNYLFLAAGAFFGAIVLSGIYMEIAVPLAVRIGGQPALDSTPWKIFQGIVSDGILVFGVSAIAIGMVGAIVLAVARTWAEFHRPSTP